MTPFPGAPGVPGTNLLTDRDTPLTLAAPPTDAPGMRIVATPDVLEFVRARGGRLFVWSVDLRYGHGFDGVFSLHAALEAPDESRRFARFAGEGIEVMFDAADHGVPHELHLALKGRIRRGVRAYWDGHSFART